MNIIQEILIKNNETITINCLKEICKALSIFDTNDIINDFNNKNLLNKKSKSSTLSPNLQIELLKQVKNGNKKARDILVLTNYSLVAHIVKKFFIYNSDKNDFIEYGIMGLIHAIDHYEFERNIPFVNYAAKCIVGYIKKYLPTNVNSLSIGRNTFFLISKVTKIEEQLMKTLNREYITDLEILEELKKDKLYQKLKINDITELRTYAKSPTSLDQTIKNGTNTDEYTIKDIIISDNDIETEAITTTFNTIFNKIFNGEINCYLKEKELTVLWYRYGFDEKHIQRTSDEVAKIMKISGARVRELERLALRKLKNLVILQDEEKNRGLY